jgi:hypothetical protein
MGNDMHSRIALWLAERMSATGASTRDSVQDLLSQLQLGMKDGAPAAFAANPQKKRASGDVESANSLIKKLQEEAAELRLLMKKAEREQHYSKMEIIEERALDQLSKLLQVDRIAYGEPKYRYRVCTGTKIALIARPDHSSGLWMKTAL